MKIWKKYRKYLLKGEWHVHTTYTDGKNTVFEYCKKAFLCGIPLIAFTEHVNKELDYDFNEFLNDIEKAREEFPKIIILSGCEAKVLADGSLDIEKKILNIVNYPIFAYHTFSNNKELYLKTLKKAIKNKYTNAWAHPEIFLKNSGFKIEDDELIKIFRLMKKCDVLLEINRKHNLPSESWIEKAKIIGVQLVKGSDIHSVKELEKASKFE